MKILKKNLNELVEKNGELEQELSYWRLLHKASAKETEPDELKEMEENSSVDNRKLEDNIIGCEEELHHATIVQTMLPDEEKINNSTQSTSEIPCSTLTLPENRSLPESSLLQNSEELTTKPGLTNEDANAKILHETLEVLKEPEVSSLIYFISSSL